MSGNDSPPRRSGREVARVPRDLRFLGHYLEMVAVMLLGMVILGGVALGILSLVDVTSGDLEEDAPAVYLIGMGASMVAPMVWWMRRRGHSAAANREMAAAMIVPTLLVLVLLAAGVTDDVHSLMGVQHATMLPAMFGVMLLSPDEYMHRGR
jgi:hypothetical protein